MLRGCKAARDVLAALGRGICLCNTSTRRMVQSLAARQSESQSQLAACGKRISFPCGLPSMRRALQRTGTHEINSCAPGLPGINTVSTASITCDEACAMYNIKLSNIRVPCITLTCQDIRVSQRVSCITCRGHIEHVSIHNTAGYM